MHTECKHLQSDNRCGIYDTRPQICRDYSTDNCEYEDDWVYDQYLETAEQVAEYAEAVLPRKKGQSIRSPKPPLLPLLAVVDCPSQHARATRHRESTSNASSRARSRAFAIICPRR